MVSSVIFRYFWMFLEKKRSVKAIWTCILDTSVQHTFTGDRLLKFYLHCLFRLSFPDGPQIMLDLITHLEVSMSTLSEDSDPGSFSDWRASNQWKESHGERREPSESLSTYEIHVVVSQNLFNWDKKDYTHGIMILCYWIFDMIYLLDILSKSLLIDSTKLSLLKLDP